MFGKNLDIKNIIVSKGITSLGDNLFYNCENAVAVDLPSTLTSIGSSAFSQFKAMRTVSGLTAVTIPQTVTVIGRHAFEQNAITEIIIPANVKTWGDYAFSGCRKLTTARIECGLIGSFAFSGCDLLDSLTISVNCKSFGSNILTYCEKLTAITYNGTKEQWNAITKPTNWMTSDAKNNYHNGYLQRINCIDGSFVWDSESKEWKEETA